MVRKFKDIPNVEVGIRNASVTSAKSLSVIIFGSDQRLNRRKILDFSGWNFEEGSDELYEKMEEAKQISLPNLIAVCVLMRLNHEGTSSQLATRICSVLNDLEAFEFDQELEASEEDDEEEENVVQSVEDLNIAPTDHQEYFPARSARRNASGYHEAKRCPINFRDIEDSIPLFAGDDTRPIETWINDFEDLATLVEW